MKSKSLSRLSTILISTKMVKFHEKNLKRDTLRSTEKWPIKWLMKSLKRLTLTMTEQSNTQSFWQLQLISNLYFLKKNYSLHSKTLTKMVVELFPLLKLKAFLELERTSLSIFGMKSLGRLIMMATEPLIMRSLKL